MEFKLWLNPPHKCHRRKKFPSSNREQFWRHNLWCSQKPGYKCRISLSNICVGQINVQKCKQVQMWLLSTAAWSLKSIFAFCLFTIKTIFVWNLLNEKVQFTDIWKSEKSLCFFFVFTKNNLSEIFWMKKWKLLLSSDCSLENLIGNI